MEESFDDEFHDPEKVKKELNKALLNFHLDTMISLYDLGERGLLPQIINLGVSQNVPLPKRIKEGFDEAIAKYANGEVSGLDEAFSVPKISAHSIKSKKFKKMRDTFILANKLHKEDSKKYPFAPESLLFVTVGKRFNITPSLARKYFYEFKKLDENLLEFQKIIASNWICTDSQN